MRESAAAFGLIMALAGGGAARGQAFDFNSGLHALANSATNIVVAEVLDTKPRRAIEGARDTVRLRVVRTLKGPLEPGDEVGVYYHLRWTDAGQNILEEPKFQQGKRCTVFFSGSKENGYTLADQWLGVVPESVSLDTDVALSLNEVGDLWSDYWRRQHRAPLVSRLRIDILPEAEVAQARDGLVLGVKIANHSSREVTMRLAHEWHGGVWPATDLYASVSHVQAKQPASFEPVYLRGENQGPTEQTRIGPGKTTTVELRMDWPGTGSVKRTPLMSLRNREYFLRFLLVFDAGRSAPEYAASAKTYVRIAAQ